MDRSDVTLLSIHTRRHGGDGGVSSSTPLWPMLTSCKSTHANLSVYGGTFTVPKEAKSCATEV